MALSYGRIAKIPAQLSNGLVNSAMGQIPCSTERISSLMMGFGKPQLHAKVEVAGFMYYENIREFVFQRQICFLSHPLSELRVTDGLHTTRRKLMVDFLFAINVLFR